MNPSIQTSFILHWNELGGVISSQQLADDCGYVCGVMTDSFAISRNDHLQGGIALFSRSGSPTTSLSPFVFRQVCSNGMVLTRVASQQAIRISDESEVAPAVDELLTTLRSETFHASISNRLRNTQQQPITPQMLENVSNRVARILRWEASIASMPDPGQYARTYAQVRLQRLMEMARNQSPDQLQNTQRLFSLINAVTDLAHEVSPAASWALMSLGAELLERVETPTPEHEMSRLIV